MNIAPSAGKKPVIVYEKLPLKLLAALVSAHLLVSLGEPESLLQLLRLWYYYPALLLNLLIALTLIFWVNWATRFLDARIRWERSFGKRVLLQGLLGVSFPLLLDTCLAAAYYRFYGDTDLWSAEHFRYDFFVITLLIILLNAYYAIWYLLQLKHRRLPIHISILETTGIPPANESYPLLIIRENRECFQINAEGEKNLLKGTIEQIQRKLTDARYFQINRKCIVERSAIQHLRPYRSRVIRLELKNKIYEDVYVSQRNASAFKVWFLTGRSV